MVAEAPPPDFDRRCIPRPALAEFIASEIAATKSRPLAVLMVNISRPRHFESLTRTSAWDVKLRVIDSRIAGVLRATDRYARLSDEKLCIVLPVLASGAQAMLAAARITSMLQEPAIGDTGEVTVRSSVGITIYPDHGSDGDELVRGADMASQVAADRGEDFHTLLPEERVDMPRMDADTEGQLMHAIRNNELVVHYQPQVDFKTRRCMGVEALLRWPSAAIRQVTTAMAISVAEQAGLIAPLTFAVINTVLRDAVRLRKQRVDLMWSINLSTKMLSDLELPEIVLQAIETWDFPADRVTFEITEGVMIGDIERSLTVLNRLRALGCELSIDDFGTGYSSLAYMKRFPVQELKIDKSFVANMLTSQGDRQIVQTVIDLSHNFSLRVVAEGVETVETFDELKTMGCDYAQGYLFSPALALDDFADWLKRHHGH